MAATQPHTPELAVGSTRHTSADVEADDKTIANNVDPSDDVDKSQTKKAKPGETWKGGEVHKIPHK
jgi:hypothetical protein